MKREIDFLASYQIKQKRSRKTGVSQRALIACVFVAALVVFGGFFAYFQIQTQRLAHEYKTLNSYITDSEQAKEYQRLLGIQGSYQALQEKNNAADEAAAAISKRPLMEQGALSAVQASLTEQQAITGLSFDKEGNFWVLIKSQNAGQIPDYIEAVEQSGYFKKVSYDGWQSQDGYLTQMCCTLKWEVGA